MNILEHSQLCSTGDKGENIPNEITDLSVLRKEVNFQFTLRDYAADPFVQVCNSRNK